jgi:hypothetical protein
MATDIQFLQSQIRRLNRRLCCAITNASGGGGGVTNLQEALTGGSTASIGTDLYIQSLTRMALGDNADVGNSTLLEIYDANKKAVLQTNGPGGISDKYWLVLDGVSENIFLGADTGSNVLIMNVADGTSSLTATNGVVVNERTGVSDDLGLTDWDIPFIGAFKLVSTVPASGFRVKLPEAIQLSGAQITLIGSGVNDIEINGTNPILSTDDTPVTFISANEVFIVKSVNDKWYLVSKTAF